VTDVGDFPVCGAISSQQDACRALNRRDPGKHRLFRNPERPGVRFIARVARASDENEQRTATLSACRKTSSHRLFSETAPFGLTGKVRDVAANRDFPSDRESQPRWHSS
jgi:hypothetical protein